MSTNIDSTISAIIADDYDYIDDSDNDSVNDDNGDAVNTSFINIIESPSSSSESESDTDESDTESSSSSDDDDNASILVSKKYNKQLLIKELQDRHKLNDEQDDQLSFLYPSQNDPLFNLKIASKMEFAENKMTLPDDATTSDIEAYIDSITNSTFELQPHQKFVRNFLSHKTPYNSLLLYHGLGTGKTCSVMGITEEYRTTLKQYGKNKKIIVVASANVQENFKLQLFDETKLKLVDGRWSISACVGNGLLSEINPFSIDGKTKDQITEQIRTLIANKYMFMGYIQFANYVINIIKLDETNNPKTTPTSTRLENEKIQLTRQQINRLKYEFKNRMVVIDEIHNVRNSSDTQNKMVSKYIEILARVVKNVHFVFLSATPMYNNHYEIIWLLNIMNANDGRSIIYKSDVFDSNGNITPNGRELIRHKATGYISYVKGENPYTFPYRMYPDVFSPSNTFSSEQPTELTQFNGVNISHAEDLSILKLYKIELQSQCNRDSMCNNCQYCVYQNIISHLALYNADFMQKEVFAYTELHPLIESLIISYPTINTTALAIDKVGRRGLNQIMTNTKFVYQYKPEIIHAFGRIFHKDVIGKYSAKIKTIVDNIISSEGPIIIYSQYIEGAIVPIALALEELGMTRYNNGANLFKTKPQNGELSMFKYSIICGNKILSPSNNEEIKAMTSPQNVDGKIIRVVVISKTGSEGIDFKSLRQVHIVDPWYNMNRNEQIIGRAVRFMSHTLLPLVKRNVEIFMYSAALPAATADNDTLVETADTYIYRIALKKAFQIGIISRILKETAVDCILNHVQTRLTQKLMNREIDQILSNQLQIRHRIGDMSYTNNCDYMENCEYECTPSAPHDTDETTYSEYHIRTNVEKIMQKIRYLMKDQFFYRKDILIHYVQFPIYYPAIHIYYAIHQLSTNEQEIIVDKYGRRGRLVDNGEYVYLLPEGLLLDNPTTFDITIPVDYKNSVIELRNEVKNVEYEIDALQIVDEIANKWNIVEQLMSGEKQHTEYESMKKVDSVKWIIAACGPLYDVLRNIIPIQSDEFKDIIMAHIIEKMPIEYKAKLLIYISSHSGQSDVHRLIHKYFENTTISTKIGDELHTCFLSYNKDANNVDVYSLKTEWKLLGERDRRHVINYVENMKLSLNIPCGFISLDEKDKPFKIKGDSKHKLAVGLVCTSGGKANIMTKINDILGKAVFTKETTKKTKLRPIMAAVELCVIFECLLRYKNIQQYNGLVWFISPEMAWVRKGGRSNA